MRIAMVVDGTRGDVQPMFVLGAALAAEGHSVRICAPPDFRSAAVSAGFEFHAIGLATIAQGHKVAYREAHGLLEELADATLDGKTRCTSPA